jgi:hypothetical protein
LAVNFTAKAAVVVVEVEVAVVAVAVGVEAGRVDDKSTGCWCIFYVHDDGPENTYRYYYILKTAEMN